MCPREVLGGRWTEQIRGMSRQLLIRLGIRPRLVGFFWLVGEEFEQVLVNQLVVSGALCSYSSFFVPSFSRLFPQ